MKKKMNKKIIYAIIVYIFFIISLLTFTNFCDYDYKLLDTDYKIETEGFIYNDSKLRSNELFPSVDIYFDGKYSAVDIFISGSKLYSVDVELYYTARNDYSKYVVVTSTFTENGFVELKLPDALSGDGYMHIVFNTKGVEFEIDKINIYERAFTINASSIIKSVLMAILVLGMIYFYEKYYVKKYHYKNYAYIFFTACLTIYFLIFAFLSRGETLHTVLFTDAHDVFGDFFHSIADALEGNPYDKYSNYPPLALLVFKLFTFLLPSSYNETVVSYENLMVYQPAIWAWLLLLLAGIYFTCAFVTDALQVVGLPEKLIKIVIIFSAPMLYEIDRGNIALVALVFTLVYVRYYNSDNKYLRELANLALAAAFAIKIYPAIFGILLVRKKRWFAAVRTAIYGAVLLIVPFFYYGFSYGVSHFLEGISINSGYDYGMGTNVSLANIMRTFLTVFCLDWNEGAYKFVLVIVVVLLFATAFVVANEHIAQISMCLLLLLVPRFNYYYAVIFAIIPFVSFLKELQTSNDSKYCMLWELLYAGIMVPMALPVIDRLSTGYKTYVTYGTILQYLSLIVMVIYCGYELIVHLRKMKKKKI